MKQPLECGDVSPLSRSDSASPARGKPSWPHAPTHWLFDPGIYMVTAATPGKALLLNTSERLDIVHDGLLEAAAEFGWRLDAWAVMANHYHFVARSPGNPATLRRVIGKLHMRTAKALNALDGTPGRKVWFQYWESRITYERSYLARLAYVHGNAVKHGLVRDAKEYKWCSAAWFVRSAPRSFVETVPHLKTDRVEVPDGF